MAKVTPNQVFPSITVNAVTGTATLSLDELKNVTATEIEPTSGDMGILCRGIIEWIYEQVQTIPSANRPVRWTITRSSETTVPNTSNSRRVTYTMTFDTVAPANQFELIAE